MNRLTVKQMWILAHMNMDFIGWQIAPKGNLITAIDRQNNGATYYFPADAKVGEIAMHISEKREQFKKGKQQQTYGESNAEAVHQSPQQD
ncbi:MAG: hypothetical protein H3C35_03580 [Bacteroidetes bacterium]|nr:hypothetical protein [Bacteroidota bacterium]